ncbi:MAG TPA: enolase C-terminal domain-like protein [Chryseolinea sp.]|nr:enolase C-terminal domain-like protein [Chryseolinea sp.]
MNSRRKFMTDLAKASCLACLPFKTQAMFDTPLASADTIIDAVDVLRLSGSYKGLPGVNRQYQGQPIHVYPELHPAPYADDPNAKETTSKMTQYYLRIRTKGGLTGFYGAIDPETVPPLLNQLRPFLLGKDATAGETLWDQMYRNNRHSRAGHYMMALSAVDNALWDLRGKKYNVPVYELLGGPTRKEARVYGSCLGFTVEKGKVGPRAKQLYNDGFVHQKWFLAYSPSDGNAGLKRNIELVEELRETLGFDAEIMFDAFMAWDVPYAIEWCKAVEKYRPYWIEEAFPTDRPENFAQLSRSTSIPVASGEHFYSRWEVLNFLKGDAIKIVQADPEWCGGVSELVKICHLASTFGAKVFPHGHSIQAALHVVVSQSPEVCPLVEYLIAHVEHKMHFQKEPLLTNNGIIKLPTKPGFGIELDTSKVEGQEVLTKI